LNSFRHS
jgi:hypothetical protein